MSIPIIEDGNSIFIKLMYQSTADSPPVTVQYSSYRLIKFKIENHSGIQLDGGMINH